MKKKFNLKIFVAILISFSCLIEGKSQQFRAAVVKKNITPNNAQHLLGYGSRVSTGVYDSIYHRIVVMDDGHQEFILVSSDICLVSPSEYDRVSEIIQKKFNVSSDQFWWTVTHTHSAPEVGPPGLPEVFLGDRYEHQYDTAYTNFTVKELVNGIEEAFNDLVPASLGVGWGYSKANINRRARDGRGGTRLGMNPDGPVDRRIGLLKIIDKLNGKLMTIIANYAIHGTVMSGHNLLISGDAPGVVAEYVENQMGAPLLFVNGAAGNIAPIYSVYPSPQAGHLDEFKYILGDKIIHASDDIIANRSNIDLEFGELIVKIPRKKGLVWTEDLKNYSVQEGGMDKVVLPIKFLKIDKDIGIWAAPLELFCEISNEIRAQSPYTYTFYYGYANGWLGYLLTDEEIQLGGYEPMVSPYDKGGALILIESVSSYLEGELLSK